MKTLLASLIVAAALVAPLKAQSRQFTRIWETEAVLKTPESVRYDTGNGVLYVSNIEGEPWDKDGKGSIGRVSLDGKVQQVDWVTGLDAPKGMGLHQGKLYVADLQRVVVVDVARGAIAQTIAVPGAQRLNDVSVSRSGVVYVSDMAGLKIYAITGGRPAAWVDGLRRPNGVLAHGNDLYVVDSGALLKFDQNKRRTRIADGMDPSTDGIEHIAGEEFLVSCWAGAIYHVKGSEKTLVLDTREQKINSADIGYDPLNRIVYVPTFFKNSVTAYQIR